MKKIICILSIILLSIVLCFLVIVFKDTNLNNINNSVVYIESINDETIRSGSGFVYKIQNNKNYIVTSYHVIEGYTNIYVYNTNANKMKANILNYDEYTDIAILSIQDDLNLEKINIGNSDKINKGDKVYVVGTPLDIKNINTISKGVISQLNKEITINTTHGSSNLETIQVTAKVDYGNSGGPLLNKENEVIGMMFIKEQNSDEISFALPINFVMNIVEKLENNELQRPNLGAVMCNTTNTDLLNKYGINFINIKGVVLLFVNDSGLLDKAELQKGDIITKFNNEEINSVNQLREELYKQEIGNTIIIEYYRNGISYKVNIKL